jgi:coenzyme Q-binding protein COQ10
MAQAVHETTYDVDAAQLLSAVTDYAKYPEFVDGMKKVWSETVNGETIVHYDLSMMGKDMSYTLNLLEEPEKGHVSWTLLKSEFFKVNNGDWLIESLGPGRCKARYFSEVEFTFPVPAFVLKPMVKGAVPKMMDSFYQRARTLPMPAPQVDPQSEPQAAPKAEPQVEPQAEPQAQLNNQKPIDSRFDSDRDDSFQSRHHKMSDHTSSDSGIFSWAKKIMTVGVGTFFLTEDSLKTMISEFKLPKEMMGTLLEGAKNVRHEFMQNVVQEVMTKVSDKMDPSAVIAEFFRKNEVTFEVKIKVKEKTDSEV